MFPLLAALCFLFSPFCFVHAAGGRYEVREVKPRVFVWIPEDILDQDGDPQFSRAGTAGFIVTTSAVVVVDTTNSPFHARELLFEIGRRTDRPLKYVINTDSGGDHFLGNEVFVDQRASIISTAVTLAEMRRYQQDLGSRMAGDVRLQARMRGFHFTFPSQTFDSEAMLSAAGEEVKLLNLGSHDSAGHLAVLLPRSKVLFLGDLFENKFFPRVGPSDVGKWIGILRQVESWDVDVFVPGHGAPGDKKDVAAFRQFLEWLSREVEARVREGKSLTQVKNELVPFERYPWRARELASEAVEAVYHQLVGAQHAPPLPTKSRER